LSLTGGLARPARADDGLFSDIGAGLAGADWGSVAWGDYDNDGRLDLLFAGCSDRYCTAYTTHLYHNGGDDGAGGWIFSEITTGLPGVGHASVAWGDYNNDGRLDILLTGDSDTGRIAKVYRSDGPNGPGGWTFTEIDAGLPGLDSGGAIWGDYDNDGRLDIALTGDRGAVEGVPLGGVTHIYHNDGNDVFHGIDAGFSDLTQKLFSLGRLRQRWPAGHYHARTDRRGAGDASLAQ